MTTSTIPLQSECSAVRPTSGPKRRRRAAATGAAEDCHACRKTKTPCDRRRPYCSQCLNIGKDCSGYRTNLTWGVGVASRGKLRGLSLPVAGHASQKSLKSHEGPKASAASSKALPKSSDSTGNALDRPQQELLCASLPNAVTYYQTDVLPTHVSSTPLRYLQTDPQNHFHYGNGLHTSQSRSSASPSSTNGSLRSSPENSSLLHASELKSHNENENQNQESTCSSSLCLMSLCNCHVPSWLSSARPRVAAAQAIPFSSSVQQDNMLPEDALTIQSHPSSDFEEVAPEAFLECQILHRSRESPEITMFDKRFMEVTASPRNAALVQVVDPNSGIDDYKANFNKAGENHMWIPAIGRALEFSNAPPRVRSLLDFYDKAICPVLVAFDGPSNPYRRYVMPLALHDKGLQSALAALATNNLRMRRLQEIPCLKGAPAPVLMQMAQVIGKPSSEEQIFKSSSIEYLNSALTRSGAAEEDSVLATLLILCLFHVCDSGFSRFKTQLIGVQKLLRMRTSRRHSDFVDWVEMFFAWFDVMTSAINDRETQIHSDSLGLVNISRELGSVEEFSGCDGRLFKVLARLGRLNLLSQGREVREITSAGQKSEKQDLAHHSPDISWSMPDERHGFWQEWYDTRERLFAWSLGDTALVQAPGAEPYHPHHDLLHISESFRFSALIYTERLAHPLLPSSSSNLQDLVAASVYHISHISMNSCVLKFLLWPLFVTGTECVLEDHRDLIRRLCGEIQKESGFYNNVSSLEVLERFWQGDDRASAAQQPFRWRDAMPRVDGEYIVI